MANQPVATAPVNETAFPLPSSSGAMILGGDAFRMALEPSNLAEAFNIAGVIASCRICGCETPEDALIRIMTGRSLGLSTMQSLRGIYVVKGRPGIDASLMHAICLQSPLCEEFVLVSSDEKQATYRAKRKGSPARPWTFTIEDAEAQGLVGRGETAEKAKENNYNKVPKDMLRARCKATLARMEFPDLLFGMYTAEELLAGVDVVDARRAGEMTGEVVPTADRSSGTMPSAQRSPVQGARRDYAAEAAALKAEVWAASTKEARDVVRKKIAECDLVEPYIAEVKAAYNAASKAARTAATAVAVPVQAATEASAAAPAASTPEEETGNA